MGLLSAFVRLSIFATLSPMQINNWRKGGGSDSKGGPSDCTDMVHTTLEIRSAS